MALTACWDSDICRPVCPPAPNVSMLSWCHNSAKACCFEKNCRFFPPFSSWTAQRSLRLFFSVMTQFIPLAQVTDKWHSVLNWRKKRAFSDYSFIWQTSSNHCSVSSGKEEKEERKNYNKDFDRRKMLGNKMIAQNAPLIKKTQAPSLIQRDCIALYCNIEINRIVHHSITNDILQNYLHITLSFPCYYEAMPISEYWDYSSNSKRFTPASQLPLSYSEKSSWH